MKQPPLQRIGIACAIGIALLVAAFIAGVYWPLPTPEPVVSREPLAIVNITVVDVRRGLSVPRQTVLLRDGRITAVGDVDSVVIPPDARRVDGRGLHVAPALWDMHTHVYAVSPLLDLPLYVAYGVTNVRDMLSCPREGDPFISCAADKRRWTAEAETGLRVGPRIVSSASFMADGPGMRERLPDLPAFMGPATAAEGRAFVRHEAARGADEVKVYDRLPREAYFAIVEEAAHLGLAVVGHRPRAVSAVELAACGQKSVEHARVFLHESFGGSDALRAAAARGEPWHEDRAAMLATHDSAGAAEIFRAFAAYGTYYVPTHLTRWCDAYADAAAVREDTLLQYLHPLMRWQWLEDLDATVAADPSPEARETYRAFYRKGLDLTGAAHRAGVKVLVGTDYVVPGADVHRELVQLVAAGLTPAEALRAATLEPARYYGLEGDYGSVEPGRVADLLLLEADPLEAIEHTQRIRAVVFGGRLYDREALEAIKSVVRRRARSWAVGCKIVARFLRQPASY